MKTAEPIKERICPKYGSRYTGVPAASRCAKYDCICPDCGVREALDSIGISSEEQEKIMETIHTYIG